MTLKDDFSRGGGGQFEDLRYLQKMVIIFRHNVVLCTFSFHLMYKACSYLPVAFPPSL